jgi:hypothetical protein
VSDYTVERAQSATRIFRQAKWATGATEWAESVIEDVSD